TRQDALSSRTIGLPARLTRSACAVAGGVATPFASVRAYRSARARANSWRALLMVRKGRVESHVMCTLHRPHLTPLILAALALLTSSLTAQQTAAPQTE